MPKLCRSLVLNRCIETLWTDGRIRQINSSFIATIRNFDVLIIDSDGAIYATLAAEEESDDAINDFVVDDLLRFAFTSHTSQLIKMWAPNDNEWGVVAQWKCPGKFPAFLQIDPQSHFLACATSGQQCYFYEIHNQNLFKRLSIPKGQISCMTYDSTGNLWIGDQFGNISILNVESGTAIKLEGESRHRQRVTGIVSMGSLVISSGLDEVLLVFDTTGEIIGQPIAISYPIHDLIIDPEHDNSVYVATPNGIKRVDIEKPRITGITTQEINQLLYFDELYSFDKDGILKSVKNTRSFILTLLEIYDVAFDAATGLSATANSTHSNIINVVGENEAFQLRGHEDLPTCIAASNGLLISGAKDCTARIWSLTEKKLLSTLIGHSTQVLAVSFVPKSDCVLTASNEIKLWRPIEGEKHIRSALSTVIAHDKDINAIAVSIDGLLICSGSDDHTAKLWRIDNDRISPLSVLRGHRRAVTSVAFSPVAKLVATGSADNSIRIWSVDSGSCISTYTEYSSSILRCVFISNGYQIITGESSGAIKVIRVKTGAVDFSNDTAHSENIWGLVTSQDIESNKQQIITGGKDGKLCFWLDNTEELEKQEKEDMAQKEEANQDLRNALRNKEYVKALRLAFKLRMPNKLREVIRSITEDESPALFEYFTELEDLDDYVQWFDYIAKWTTNSRWADDATVTITVLLKVKPISFFVQNKRLFQTKIDAIIPYLERHQDRLDKLDIQTYAIDDVFENMPED